MQEIHEGLDFSMHEDVESIFGIFSIKFSSDGRELVAGSSDHSIYVYDLEANKLKSRFPAHSVRVCFVPGESNCSVVGTHLCPLLHITTIVHAYLVQIMSGHMQKTGCRWACLLYNL